MQIPVLHSPEEAEAFVAARKTEGSDVIKIVYQSERAIYKSMPSISRESLQAVISAAHRQQLKAVVHIAEQASALDAVEAGADGLVHSFFDSRISDALLQALKSRDVFVMPTMTVYEAAVRGMTARQVLLDNAALDLPMGAMHQAGVRLLAGTDAPNAGTYHGLSMLLELALLQEAGLSFFEALSCATAIPAQAFALEQRGQIAVGYRADFLLLPALNQPADLLSARIYKNGQLVTLSRNPPQRPAVKAGALADFSRSDKPLQGAAFAASSDQLMQGKSSASLTLQPQQSPASLRVDGKLVPGLAYPWAGVAWSAAADYQQGLDFSAISTLQFQVRGSIGTYRLLAFSEGNQRPAELTFDVTTDWRAVQIPLSQLTGIDPSRLSMLVWSASPTPQAQDFVLELAEVSLLSNSGQ
jgi:hypothetical protein